MSDQPSPPRTVGPYTVQHLLGMGADSTVWKADGPRGPVALKVARTPEARERLAREADVLQRCAHPHLVRLEGRSADGAWVALELLRGDPLDVWAKDRPVEEIVRVITELIGVVWHLHRAKVVHADIKPANILIDDWGHPKLIDLGGDLGPNQKRRFTAGFAAPEVVSGAEPSPAADLYGVAASMYAALTGKAPFDVPDPGAALHLATASSPLPPSTWRVDLPGRVDKLLLAMLARDPAQRPSRDDVEKDLAASWRSDVLRPIVGMAGTRMALHREVARASGGRAAVVVLYGPPGSGRRTLAQEAVRQARREGMRYIESADVGLFTAAQQRGDRPVAVARTGREGVVDLARRMLRSPGAALLILYDTRPAAELELRGVVQLTPDPLDLDAARQLAAWLGSPQVRTLPAWRETGGHPASLWQALRRNLPKAAEDRSLAPTRDAARLLEVLRTRPGAHPVATLARALRMPAGQLLDESAALVSAGLLAWADDGLSLRAP